ncbi:MAG TPA: DUF3604 domain-containing protein [Myxococcota bacterium]|nr:DUF3604 domain-containing protein [Myxococcota bacterium]
MVKKIALAAAALIGFGLGIDYAAGRGAFGAHDGPGEIAGRRRPLAEIEARVRGDREAGRALGAARPKQVLFGDLHVHTTFSFDAFTFSLPMVGGEGAHPPADACDFARYCSSLDFWSINDHDFSITPQHWRETIDSIRQCNAVAGDPASPDMVAYLGWEWTQVGTTPDKHYGHKNVVFEYTDDARIPARPISALEGIEGGSPPPLGLGLLALRSGGRTHDFARYFAELAAVPLCDSDTNTRDLPRDCREQAKTPADLFRKLDEWGYDAIVIPHGTTWGFYTPPGSSWDKQLKGDMHDPQRQRLIEVFSGHGDSEVFRPWHEIEFAADGSPVCPAPTKDYLPTCWRAGELIRERCTAAGESAETCEQRAVAARANAAAAGVAAHKVVPGAEAADWLDAGQCRDCREPAFNYRPKSSVQYIEALGNFDAPGPPRHFRFGFIASSDNHFGRPGTGYKQKYRRGMTESQGGPNGGGIAALLGVKHEAPAAESRPISVDQPGFNTFEVERAASFLGTGGLVAVHATGRDRESIWAALQRREVYGTTGQRTLLWFDLLNPPGSRGELLPMGSETRMDESPIFSVRAVGSFEQKPGCPPDAAEALGHERLERLCKGECYHPGDQRRPITRIEIVRIVPQAAATEGIEHLIDDPWRVFECDPDPQGCAATFNDPEFPDLERDVLYYARVFEAPEPAINAGNLRCERDAQGNCTKVNLCPGPQGDADDCLAPREPRAWSSPIYVDFDKP